MCDNPFLAYIYQKVKLGHRIIIYYLALNDTPNIVSSVYLPSVSIHIEWHVHLATSIATSIQNVVISSTEIRIREWRLGHLFPMYVSYSWRDSEIHNISATSAVYCITYVETQYARMVIKYSNSFNF